MVKKRPITMEKSWLHLALKSGTSWHQPQENIPTKEQCRAFLTPDGLPQKIDTSGAN